MSKFLRRYAIGITGIMLMISSAGGLFAQHKFIKNPIVKGHYADPTIIKDKGVYYIYATKDPWGGKELGV